MRDEDVLILLGLGLLALSGMKKVEAKKEEVPAPAGVGGAVAPEELAKKIQESPKVKSEIENIAVQPIEKMLIFEPEQPIQIQPQPAKSSESITIQPIQISAPVEKKTEEITTQAMFQPVVQPQLQPQKIPCNLRGSGYPWDWVDCGVSGYMNCLDQILGAFPDSRLACGVLVYLYKNNMISSYCCHRYCVNCNDICFGWASELISGEKISGYCDNQGNCYIQGGVQVYPFDKEYVLSTGDQVLIANLRQLGCL